MKILLICESFSSNVSGGRVAKYLYKILNSHNNEVKVITTNQLSEDSGLEKISESHIAIIPKTNKVLNLLHSLTSTSVVPNAFSELINSFNPDVVHFASFDHTKDSILYLYCKSRNIRIILQPWTMHFYCAQGFGFKDGHQCTDCITYGLHRAITSGCTGIIGGVRQIERKRLLSFATTAADVILSSNSGLDSILQQSGVPKERIVRFPVPFDIEKAKRLHCEEKENYFIYYGQTNDHKGTRTLIDQFCLMPDMKLRIYPMCGFSPHRVLTPNVEIVHGVSWGNGLLEAIENALAVVQPSLWCSSTEYALCEAMAMGKAIIAFNVGVHRDILKHEQNAMIVDVGDYIGFKTAVHTLATNVKLRRKISEGAYKTIVDINKVETLYQKLIVAYIK